MSSTARIQVVFSIYKSQWVGSIVEKLLSRLDSPGVPGEGGQQKPVFPPYIFLHFPSRVLPSTWGGGLGTRGTGGEHGKEAPAPAQADVLSSVQLESLHSLIRSLRVGLLPAGYSGAMHPLLHSDEIVHDAEWGLSNPWRSGFRDHFGSALPVFVPFWPEVSRARPKESAAYPWWCEGVYSPNRESKLVFSNQDAIRRAMSYLRVNEGAGQLAKLLRHITEADSPVFLHIAADPEEIGGHLDLLASENTVARFEFGNDFSILENAPNFEKINEVGNQRAAPLSPGFRSKLGQFPTVRKSRIGGQERVRGLLIDADPEASGDSVPNQSEPEKKQRSLLAAMQGNAVLMSDDFQTEFVNGFAVAFRREGQRIPFRCEPGAEMRFSHTKKSYETESAVSFETDQTRGMRQSLRFVHPECKFQGRGVVDYFIADRSRYLLIDFSLRHPWFAKNTSIESLTPLRFVIDLPETCQKLELERRHSDGSIIRSVFELAEKSPEKPGISAAKNLIDQVLGKEKKHGAKPHFLPGSRWVFRWKDGSADRGLVVSLLDFENGFAVPMELVIDRGAKPRLLVMPEGSYRNIGSQELEGLSQHLSLALYPLFEAGQEVPTLDTFAERELSPSYIVRQR